MEIGVQSGASLTLWNHYFPHATLIGVDINPRCKQYERGRIIVEIGSQDDPEFLATLMRKYSPSIIIDDGSHLAHHVTFTFEHLFPFLEPGGLYVVEDMFFHCGPHAERYRGMATITPPAYFLELSRMLVREGIEPEKNFGNSAYFRRYIDEIAFVPNGAAFIRKRAPEDATELIAQAEDYAQQTGKAIHWVRVADFIQRKGGPSARAEAAARRAVEIAEQSDPDDVVSSQAYIALSRAQNASGRPEEAIRSATRATELARKDASSWHHLGQLLLSGRAYEPAAAAFGHAIGAGEAHFPSYEGLCKALRAQQKFAEAKSVLIRGIAASRGGPWSAIFNSALSELEPLTEEQRGS